MSRREGRERKRAKKEKAKSEFIDQKATFLAGAFYLVLSLLNILSKLVEIPWIVILILYGVFGASAILVIATKVFDKKLKDKKPKNFGSFLTIMTVLFSAIELLNYIEWLKSPLNVIIQSLLFLPMAFASVHLLFGEY